MKAVVHALDRYAASSQGFQGVRGVGVLVLRSLTDGYALNTARLEASGGAHYLQQQ